MHEPAIMLQSLGKVLGAFSSHICRNPLSLCRAANTQRLQLVGFHLPSAPSAGESSLASGKLAKHVVQVCGTALAGQQEQQVHHMSRDAGQATQQVQQVHKGSQARHELEVISSDDEHQGGAGPIQVEEPEEPFNPSLSGAFVQPMICRFEMCKREIVDGFGLCSPGRWTPAARERLMDAAQTGHARTVRNLLERFVREQLGDVKKFSFMLATGKILSSPFSEEALSGLRKSIAATLSGPAGALEVPERQPFYLYLLAQSLQILGDPDWAILTQGEECHANGMPLGHDKPLPRVPQVFRRRLKSRKLGETPFDPIMSNYVSAELSSEQLEAQFRKDAEQGMMIATTRELLNRSSGPTSSS